MLVETVLQKKGGGVVTGRSDMTVGEAARVLAEHRIGALVIVDADDTIAGILSERDIVRGMAIHGAKCEQLTVRDLMTSEVVVCQPSDTLERLMAVMTNRRLRHLPVVKDGRLAGIITIGDIVKSRLDEATMVVDSLREYVMTAR